jgi:hypothetical protein
MPDRDNSPKVVAAFQTAPEAEAARVYLDAEGIEARLTDDATAGWFWHYSNAIGGVKVVVAERDFSAAKALLDGVSSAPRPVAVATGDTAGEASQDDTSEVACPSCGEFNPRGWESCWSCRDEIRPAATKHPETPHPTTGSSSAVAPAELSSAWKCPACSKSSPVNFNVCWSCGIDKPAVAIEQTGREVGAVARMDHERAETSNALAHFLCTTVGRGFFFPTGIFSFFLFLRYRLGHRRRVPFWRWALGIALLLDIFFAVTLIVFVLSSQREG